MRDEMKFQITISHSFIFFLFNYDSDIIRLQFSKIATRYSFILSKTIKKNRQCNIF